MSDWVDDFWAYKLSQSEGSGKPSGCLAWIFGGMIVLGIISMLIS